MHVKSITLNVNSYPYPEAYPFCLKVLQGTRRLELERPVTFFVGENGAGKSTLLYALARALGIHIWEDTQRTRCQHNPHEDQLHRFIKVEWVDDWVPGSFFAAEIFKHFAQNLDEWAAADPGMLRYFGGRSLLTQSHGQSLMSFFTNRYGIKGVYLLDEPETALSPATQIELLKLLNRVGQEGHAQFIIATHSPILMAARDAVIYNFETTPISPIEYRQTGHYRVFAEFMANPEGYLERKEEKNERPGIGANSHQ